MNMNRSMKDWNNLGLSVGQTGPNGLGLDAEGNFFYSFTHLTPRSKEIVLAEKEYFKTQKEWEMEGREVQTTAVPVVSSDRGLIYHKNSTRTLSKSEIPTIAPEDDFDDPMGWGVNLPVTGYYAETY